jgi:polysaccharide transporter, PST family
MSDARASASGAPSVRSGAIMVVGRGVQLALQLALLAILARVLTPADYGVAAYVFPVALLVQGIANGGLQSAIIQHAALTDVESSAIFWASLRWNAWLAAGMVVCGPLLAVIYDEAAVVWITTAWAAVIFLATLSAVHEARLKREFKFGRVLGAHLIAQVVSMAVAIWAARQGARYWTIIIQMMVVEFGRVGLVWAMSSWRPMAPSRLGAARDEAIAELRAYWRGFAGARFFTWIGEQADRLTVGAMFGREPVAFYDQAKKWGTFAFVEPYQALTEVAVASLSRVRDDASQLTTYARNAFLPILATALPVAGFLFAEPRGVLQFVLGTQWLAAAPLLQAMAVGSAFGIIARLAAWVSLATGGTGRQLQLAVVTTPLAVGCILLGSGYGVIGVAVGVAASQAAAALPSLVYLLAPTEVRASSVLAVWTIPLASSMLGVVALRLFGDALPSATAVPGLVIRGLVFLGIYALGWVLAPGGLAMLRAARPSRRAA